MNYFYVGIEMRIASFDDRKLSMRRYFSHSCSGFEFLIFIHRKQLHGWIMLNPVSILTLKPIRKGHLDGKLPSEIRCPIY